MSDIDTVRALIQDMPFLVQEALLLDGQQTAARTTYYPVRPTTVSVNASPTPTVSAQSGLLMFATAPTQGTYVLSYEFVCLSDATIQAMLDMQAEDDGSPLDTDAIKLAAANALDALASSQALIQKRIKLLDLNTDGPSVAKALRDHAQNLRKQVTDPAYNELAFDFAEQINDTWGYREKVLKDALRQGE